jgi:hypothetical protein
MDEINEYLKTVEDELNEIQAKVESNPEVASQYESRLIELVEELVAQLTKIEE